MASTSSYILFTTLTALALAIGLKLANATTDGDVLCMVAVNDTTASKLFGSTEIVTPHLKSFKTKDVTACTTECCNTDRCNVATFHQLNANQTTEQSANSSSCQLYACHPTQTCSFQPEEGVLLFISKPNVNENDTDLTTPMASNTSITTNPESNTNQSDAVEKIINNSTPSSIPSSTTSLPMASITSNSFEQTTVLPNSTAKAIAATDLPPTTPALPSNTSLNETNTHLTTTTVASPTSPSQNNSLSNSSRDAIQNTTISSNTTTDSAETTSSISSNDMNNESQAVPSTTPVNQIPRPHSNINITTTTEGANETLQNSNVNNNTQNNNTSNKIASITTTPQQQTTLPDIKSTTTANDNMTTSPLSTIAPTTSLTNFHSTTAPATKDKDNNTNNTIGSSDNSGNNPTPGIPNQNNSVSPTPSWSETTPSKVSTQESTIIQTTAIPTILSSNNTNSTENSNSTILAVPSPETAETVNILLICAVSFGSIFLLATVGVLGKRIFDGYRKRHYSRLDYLINGMYN